MENNILAVFIQEGSKIVSELLRNRSPAITTQTTPDSLERFIQESDIRLKPYISKPEPEVVPIAAPPAMQINIKQTENVEPGKASQIATGCVPCAMGHFGTCTGILNESIRFSRSPDGLASPEVIDRVGMCMDELNAMERVDLRPEMTVQLSGWEKDLADRTLAESRKIRHTLENLKSIEELEQVAALTQSTRKEIGRAWFQNKMDAMPPEDKEEVRRRLKEKIEEMAQSEE